MPLQISFQALHMTCLFNIYILWFQTTQVRVTPAQSSSNNVQFFMTYNSPNITDFTPKTGSTLGGYNITISVRDRQS